MSPAFCHTNSRSGGDLEAIAPLQGSSMLALAWEDMGCGRCDVTQLGSLGIFLLSAWASQGKLLNLSEPRTSAGGWKSLESTELCAQDPAKLNANQVGIWECSSHLCGSREAMWSGKLSPLSGAQVPATHPCEGENLRAAGSGRR